MVLSPEFFAYISIALTQASIAPKNLSKAELPHSSGACTNSFLNDSIKSANSSFVCIFSSYSTLIRSSFTNASNTDNLTIIWRSHFPTLLSNFYLRGGHNFN